MTIPLVGVPRPRVEAEDKVTGRALYAAEHKVQNLAYGRLLAAPGANGELLHIERAQLEQEPGVLGVLVAGDEDIRLEPLPPPAPPLPLQNRRIVYAGQPVGMVVAETALKAAAAIRAADFNFRAETPIVTPELSPGSGDAPAAVVFQPPDSCRGDPEGAFSEAVIQLDESYSTSANSHAPIEPHAVIAVWTNESSPRLHVYCGTQGVLRVRDALCTAFGLATESVLVESPHVGGGFGSKLRCLIPLALLTALAARKVQRPVRLELSRAEVFVLAGHRQPTGQRVRLGADANGKLTSIIHDIAARDSHSRRYSDGHGFPTRMLYASPNVRVRHRTVAAHVGEPQEMRAPGDATGSFAMETALDELAYLLRLDPLELRRRNHACFDQHRQLPFSSNSLLACYDEGAKRFGWSTRPLACGTLRDVHHLLGWGMASACYQVLRLPAEVVARKLGDGTLEFATATHDIGTGTRTAMAQLGASALGVDPSRVKVVLGRSDLPLAPPSVGSMTAASIAPAIIAAARALEREALQVQGDGWRTSTGTPIEVRVSTDPGAIQERYSSHSFGAVFVEVAVDEALAELRVRRIVAVYACGRILNLALARSQAIGGLVFGIGQALSEQMIWDEANGQVVNADLGQYLIPVNADIPSDLDVHFLDEVDLADDSGVKTLGMMGTVGTAAAIGNAVFHATGRRLRSLPITPEKLIE